MKSVVLVLAAMVVVAAAQPTAYYKQAGTYQSLGANFGFDIPLPQIPSMQIQVANLPLPVPTLRQGFFNIPLPRLEYPQAQQVRKPHHGYHHWKVE